MWTQGAAQNSQNFVFRTVFWHTFRNFNISLIFHIFNAFYLCLFPGYKDYILYRYYNYHMRLQNAFRFWKMENLRFWDFLVHFWFVYHDTSIFFHFSLAQTEEYLRRFHELCCIADLGRKAYSPLSWLASSWNHPGRKWELFRRTPRPKSARPWGAKMPGQIWWNQTWASKTGANWTLSKPAVSSSRAKWQCTRRLIKCRHFYIKTSGHWFKFNVLSPAQIYHF